MRRSAAQVGTYRMGGGQLPRRGWDAPRIALAWTHWSESAQGRQGCSWRVGAQSLHGGVTQHRLDVVCDCCLRVRPEVCVRRQSIALGRGRGGGCPRSMLRTRGAQFKHARGNTDAVRAWRSSVLVQEGEDFWASDVTLCSEPGLACLALHDAGKPVVVGYVSGASSEEVRLRVDQGMGKWGRSPKLGVAQSQMVAQGSDFDVFRFGRHRLTVQVPRSELLNECSRATRGLRNMLIKLRSTGRAAGQTL